MKKILSVLMAILFVVSSVNIALAEDVKADAPKRNVLNALNIMSIENNSEYVTRDEFFSGLLYMAYDSFDYESIREILADKGILADSSNSVYAGDKYITYNDAVASVVAMLGYDHVAKWGEGYPDGYIKIAQNIGILKGVIGSRTLSVTRDSIVNLFCNAIEAEPCVAVFTTGTQAFETATGETILSKERKIYKISGTVEANRLTSITGTNGTQTDQIVLDGKKYLTNGTDADSLLGMLVEAYVQQYDGEDGNIIFIAPKNGTVSELTIEDSEILSVSADCSSIKYEPKGQNRERTAKISLTVRVIYNGRFYASYTDDDFKIKNGNLRLVDNDSDNVYDWVFITSNETFIVDYVDSTTYTVFGRYTYPAAQHSIVIDEDKDNDNVHYYLGDIEVSFSEIERNDVLSIQKSKEATGFVANIYISRDVINGRLSAFNQTERTVTIDDREYDVLQSCLDEIAVSGNSKVGYDYAFYIDSFGRLALIEFEKRATDYCLFYRVKEDRRNNTYIVEYLDDASKWNSVPLARRVTYNDTRENGDKVYTYLKAEDPQVMIIKCNKNGEVSNILTANQTNKFTKTWEKSLRYRKTGNTFNCEIYLENNARVFVFPQSLSGGKEEYFVTTSSYLDNANYTMSAYDVDEYNFTGAISVKYVSRHREWLMVEKIFTELDEYGEVVDSVTGAMGSYLNVKFQGDPSVFAGLTKGSIIKLYTDSEDKVTGYEHIKATTNNLWDEEKIYEGYIVLNNPASERMKLNDKSDFSGANSCLRCSKSTLVLIYDSKEKNIKATNTSALIPGDHVFITVNLTAPQTIMVLR